MPVRVGGEFEKPLDMLARTWETSLVSNREEHEMVDVIDAIGALGAGKEEHPEGYSLDFGNIMLGSPYVTSTGYLPDRETAEGVAALVIPLLDRMAQTALRHNPSLGDCRTHPEDDTGTWCTVVSAQSDEGGAPVTVYDYMGDAFFVAGVAMPWTFCDGERVKYEKVRQALAA